jgi:hypothetical protein
VRRLTNLAVMVDRCARVDNGEILNRRFRVNYGARHHGYPVTQFGAWRNNGVRADRADQLVPFTETKSA